MNLDAYDHAFSKFDYKQEIYLQYAQKLQITRDRSREIVEEALTNRETILMVLLLLERPKYYLETLASENPSTTSHAAIQDLQAIMSPTLINEHDDLMKEIRNIGYKTGYRMTSSARNEIKTVLHKYQSIWHLQLTSVNFCQTQRSEDCPECHPLRCGCIACHPDDCPCDPCKNSKGYDVDEMHCKCSDCLSTERSKAQKQFDDETKPCPTCNSEHFACLLNRRREATHELRYHGLCDDEVQADIDAIQTDPGDYGPRLKVNFIPARKARTATGPDCECTACRKLRIEEPISDKIIHVGYSGCKCAECEKKIAALEGRKPAEPTCKCARCQAARASPSAEASEWCKETGEAVSFCNCKSCRNSQWFARHQAALAQTLSTNFRACNCSECIFASELPLLEYRPVMFNIYGLNRSIFAASESLTAGMLAQNDEIEKGKKAADKSPSRASSSNNPSSNSPKLGDLHNALADLSFDDNSDPFGDMDTEGIRTSARSTDNLGRPKSNITDFTNNRIRHPSKPNYHMYAQFEGGRPVDGTRSFSGANYKPRHADILESLSRVGPSELQLGLGGMGSSDARAAPIIDGGWHDSGKRKDGKTGEPDHLNVKYAAQEWHVQRDGSHSVFRDRRREGREDYLGEDQLAYELGLEQGYDKRVSEGGGVFYTRRGNAS